MNQNAWWLAPASILNQLLRKAVYQSRLCTWAIFGCWPTLCESTSYWELGTLVLKRALARDLRRGMQVLEVGTGANAVLALWSVLRCDVQVTATELDPFWVEAAQNATKEQAAVSVVQADLMSGIPGTYDAIWFHPPGIPYPRIEALVAEMQDERQRENFLRRGCGGETGTEVTERFYAQAAEKLSTNGKTYIVFNLGDHTDERMEAVAGAGGFEIIDRVRLPLLPYCVHVAQLSRSPGADSRRTAASSPSP